MKLSVPVKIVMEAVVTITGVTDDMSPSEIKDMAEEKATDLLDRLPASLEWRSADVRARPSAAFQR